MLKMIKRLDPPAVAASLLVGAVLLFGGIGVANAASITNVEFGNGDVTIQGTGGSTVTAKLRIVVGAGEVVEKVQTDVLSDSLAPVCVEVGGEKGLEEGTHFVDVQVKLPPNTGTYTLEAKASGIYGAFKTVDCTSNIVATASFGGALKVVGSSSGSIGGSGDTTISALLALIEDLKKQIAELMKGPAKPAFCAGMPVYNGSNAWAVQAWLLGQSQFNGGFHAAGVYSPTGNWKSISQAAYAQAQAACN